MSISIISKIMIKFILPIALFIAAVYGISYFWSNSTSKGRKMIAIGLIIGIIQAATSINEMTLSFVPKVVIVILTIALFSNYLILGLTEYFMFIFERVATLN